MKEKEWENLLRIKTTGRDDTRSDTFRYPYEPTSYEVLERLANTGLIGKNNTLLDYGCGKGRVSIFMTYQTKYHSIEIFKSVLANIIDSYYEAQREMLIMCYYPSDEYLMCLSQEYNVTFVEEIDCSDVSDGEAEREKIVVYRVGEGE